MTDHESHTNQTTPASDYLADLIRKVTATPPKDEPASPAPDLLSALSSNPELLSKLPALLSAAKPVMELFSGAGVGKEQVPTQVAPIKKEISKGDGDRRAALLCAMKPYLSRERQATIDYVIKLSKLGDVLKSL